LQVGQVTHRRFLNFCPFPVSHQPALPSQAVQGFGSGGGSFGIVGLVLVMMPACAAIDRASMWRSGWNLVFQERRGGRAGAGKILPLAA
jgi:hypothetical protein